MSIRTSLTKRKFYVKGYRLDARRLIVFIQIDH
jgi:hypothetical protein